MCQSKDAGQKGGQVGYFLDEQTLQLLTAVIETLSISGIDHPDEGIGLLEVVLPVCPKSLLAAHIPCEESVRARRWEGR